MARARKNEVPASRIKPAPVVLIVGKEAVLGERMARRVLDQAVSDNPQRVVVKVDARSYQAGSLAMHSTPSVFGDVPLIYATHCEAMNDAFLADMLAYCEHPQPDVVVVLLHGGGVRGKKLLDTIAKHGYPQTTLERVTKDSDKAALIRGDVRAAKRKITDGAVEHLVDAFGQDVRELLSTVAQLLADVDGMITEDDVRVFSAGRSEATPFDVAELAVNGKTGEALVAVRHAFANRVDPVPLVSAMAVKLRQLALAQGATRGRSDTGMAPWQLDRARRQLRFWSGEGLAQAICAVATADEQVKGASRDPQYAVEHAIVAIGEARNKRF